MTGDGRDKQQSGLCCAATSLLLVIHATSLDTLCSDLATHVAERKKRVCDTNTSTEANKIHSEAE